MGSIWQPTHERRQTLARRPASRSCRVTRNDGVLPGGHGRLGRGSRGGYRDVDDRCAAWWHNRGRGGTQELVVRFPVRQCWSCRSSIRSAARSRKSNATCRLSSQIGGRLKDVHRKEAGDVLRVVRGCREERAEGCRSRRISGGECLNGARRTGSGQNF